MDTNPRTNGKPFKVSADDAKTSSHTSRRHAEVKVGQLVAAGHANVQINYYDRTRGSVKVIAQPVSLGWVPVETSSWGVFDSLAASKSSPPIAATDVIFTVWTYHGGSFGGMSPSHASDFVRAIANHGHAIVTDNRTIRSCAHHVSGSGLGHDDAKFSENGDSMAAYYENGEGFAGRWWEIPAGRYNGWKSDCRIRYAR